MSNSEKSAPNGDDLLKKIVAFAHGGEEGIIETPDFKEGIRQAIRFLSNRAPHPGEHPDFYCNKPSDIPCHTQCELCRKYDPRNNEQETVPRHQEQIKALQSQIDFERELVKKQEHTIETLLGKLYKKELEAGSFRTMLEDIIELRDGYYTQEDMEDRLDKIEPLLKQFPEDEK